MVTDHFLFNEVTSLEVSALPSLFLGLDGVKAKLTVNLERVVGKESIRVEEIMVHV